MSWWALLANAVGGTITQRSQAAASGAQTQAQLDMQQRLAEMGDANTRNIANAARRWDLEDRGYRTERFGTYGQFGDPNLPSNGTPGSAPGRVDSPFTPIEAPQAIPEPAAAPLKPGQKPPKKPKKPPPQRGLMYFG